MRCQVVCQPEALFVHDLFTDGLWVIQSGRAGARDQVGFVGHVTDELKVKGDQIRDFFELGGRIPGETFEP